MKYKVITILNPDLKPTTLCWENNFDNVEHPELEDKVGENDWEMLVLSEDGKCFKVDSFFYMNDIKEFTV
jgi:hypothetical protein